MILGIGTDLAEIARFAGLLERQGERALTRLLSDAERSHCASIAQPAAFLAKRFAAKEAFLKALGTGLRDGLAWSQISVEKDALGKPHLQLSGRAAELAAQKGVQQIHLSLSDERAYALALVVLEG